MKVNEDYQLKGQMSIFDLLSPDSWYGKTSQEPSAAELPKEPTSKQSSKKSSKSSSRTVPIFLYLKRGGTTQEASTEWVTTDFPSAFRGGHTMLNFGESPNVVVESRLSQILEEHPHPKYSLSARACQGILRRSEKRGKELPPILKEALTRQSLSKSEQDVRGGERESSSNENGLDHSQHSLTNQSLQEPICISKASHFISPTQDGRALNLNASDFKDPQAICYGLDRASFNQGQNAKYDFSIEEEKAQTIVAKGPGGGNDIVGSLQSRDLRE